VIQSSYLFACAGKTAALHNRCKDAHPVQYPLIEILIHAFCHFYYAIHD